MKISLIWFDWISFGIGVMVSLMFALVVIRITTRLIDPVFDTRKTDKALALQDGYTTIKKDELLDLRFRVSSWGNKLKALQEWGRVLPESYQTQLYNILANGKPEL